MHLTGVLSKVAVIIAAVMVCGVTETFCQDGSLHSRLQIDKIYPILEAECEKNGKSSAYQNLEDEIEDAVTCWAAALPSQEEFKNDIIRLHRSAAEQNIQLKPFISKYCRIPSKVRQCGSSFTAAVEVCLDPEEKSLPGELVEIADSVANLICHNDGDRLTKFLAADGITCIQNHSKELTKCEAPLRTLKEVPSKKKICELLTNFKTCVMKAVESCTVASDLLGDLVDIFYRVEKCETSAPPKSTYTSTTTYYSSAPRTTPMIVFGVGVVAAAGYWAVAGY